VSDTVEGPLGDACEALRALLGVNPEDESLTRH
jgi:hypothetical protein